MPQRYRSRRRRQASRPDTPGTTNLLTGKPRTGRDGIAGAHWVTVRLKGAESNAFGMGARVEATAGGVDYVGEAVTTTSAFTAVQPQVHFGFGETSIIDRLTVHCPSGSMTERQAAAADRVLTIAA